MQRHPLLEQLQNIWFFQRSIKKPTEVQKLYLIIKPKDTIPILLYLKDGKTFAAYGNIGNLNGSECFLTSFFRIEEINNYFVTFSLLKPTYREGSAHDICDVIHLEKASYCIEVNIHMFGGIQFLSPQLVY